MYSLAGEAFGEGGGVAFDLMRSIEGCVGVVDTQATPGVDGADFVAVVTEIADECSDSFKGRGEGIDLADLGADVDRHTVGFEPFGFGGAAVDGAGEFDVDAELVFGEAGGDVRVGLGEDVGIDAGAKRARMSRA